ncbi:MAG: hypothetical protein FWD36_09985 [Treponema sp.]|nr:hypothetical protein [Treponema sp.]
MKNKIVLWAILVTLVSIAIPVQLAATEASADRLSGVELDIRFFDRRIYYVDAPTGGAPTGASDPVYIQLTIINKSPSTYRFKLADERAFSLDFDVRTTSNRPLEAADSLIEKRTRHQQVFFREIAIEPGESFSFVEDLRSYIKLTQPGSMVLRARMYPELFRPEMIKTTSASSGILESQRLSLNIRPAVITGPDGIPLQMDVATGALLVRERLSPDQVVDYMITAGQKSQWERFFLYLDIEAMLQAESAELKRKWLAESEQGRRRMAEQYRKELQANAASGAISIIPTLFVIERTEYTNSEGTVTVLKRFNRNRFTEIKRYTYSLRMQDNIWTIVDYSLVFSGTE